MNRLKDRVTFSIIKIENGLERMAIEASKACMRLSNLLGDDIFRKTKKFMESHPQLLDDPDVAKEWNRLKQYRSEK